MQYALLQRYLDQTLTREQMEEASVAAPEVARADCARLHRELFGIVADRLDKFNARAFQQALAAFGFECDLVPESELFRLPPAYGINALGLDMDHLEWADLYGRGRRLPMRACVFVAAGWLAKDSMRLDNRHRSGAKAEMRIRYMANGGVAEQTGTIARVQRFRLDCFLSEPPFRIEWSLAWRQIKILNGHPVQCEDTETLSRFLRLLVEKMPPGRTNRGAERFGRPDEPIYPNPRAFDEEIIWHFHRLRIEQRRQTPPSAS